MEDQKYESCCHFIVILGCGSCGTADWSIWHQLTVGVFVCMHGFYVCTCVYVCQCLCVSTDRVGASPHSLLLGSAHNRTRWAHRHLCMFSRGTSLFQNKHTAACQPTKPQHTPYWQRSPASLQPLASMDWPSFSAWSSLTAACLLIGRSCKMSNYCSLG